MKYPYLLQIMKQQEISRGKKNWMKLKSIILSKTLVHKQKDKKLSLFSKSANVCEGKLITQYSYKDCSFMQAAPQPIFKELIHFQSEIDATGKWIWEAEEIAAFYFINQYQRYLKLWNKHEQAKQIQVFRVLELGAGCSGLAGIALVKQFSKFAPDLDVQLILSDGQEESIQFLNLNLQLNGLKNAKNKSRLLKWGSHGLQSNHSSENTYKNTFDLIIICDCLYFTDFHKELVSEIEYYLSLDGFAILINPSRGDSMKLFLQICNQAKFQWKFRNFQNEKYQSECQKISKFQTFNKEKDVFYFIQLNRHRKSKPQ